MYRGGVRHVVTLLLALAFCVFAGLSFGHVVNAVPEDQTSQSDTSTAEATKPAAGFSPTRRVNGASPKPTNNPNAPDQDKKDDAIDGKEGSCNSALWGFGWLFCPGQNLVTTMIDGIYGWIADSFSWTIMAGHSSDQMKDIWQKFLNIANIIFAIGFLLMIYSMATSTVLSNYQIKKFLPTLVVVAILVNMSFYVCAALVDISNIAGKSVYELFMAQTTEAVTPMQAVNSAVSTVASAALMVLAVIMFGGTVVLGLMIVLVVIVFRQVALTALVILSPIAIALYLMPVTRRRWWELWKKSFISLLVVYPLFSAVWGASHLIANVLATTGSSGVPGFLIDFLCAIAPAVSIIPLFKMTAGGMNKLTAALQRNGLVKKGASSINGFGRDIAKDSRLANAARSWGSRAALGVQNKLGTKRGIGKLVTSPGFSKAINAQADHTSKLDKAAMDQAETWVSRNLTTGQMGQILESGGTYTDNKGRSVTLADPYKIRAAINKGNIGTSYDRWIKAMQNYDDVSDKYIKSGQPNAAKDIRDAYANAMFSSKNAPFMLGDIAKWQNGKWSVNDRPAFDNAIAKFASSLSSEKLADTLSSNQRTLQTALDGINPASLSTADRANYDKAIKNMRSAATNALGSKMIMRKTGPAERAALGEMSYLRTSSEYSAAHSIPNGATMSAVNVIDSYNTHIANYKTSPEANKAIQQAVYDATMIRASSSFKSLSAADQRNIDQIYQQNYNSAPKPVNNASWR